MQCHRAAMSGGVDEAQVQLVNNAAAGSAEASFRSGCGSGY